ncbi:hypothetical protein ABW19_dt0201400 [Dactylella cylindrospora]|uniref:Homing endonuclease LAGLIDADG domain-containing protein n=1 Tax=Dactylella tenuis TaxID=383872 RepID=A0A4Y5MUZ5_9PEZI|nr:hypothetical protein [Dactylella tenuis]KAF3930963.1 hypothetical protein ABW19_dt0201400 [Dactylella cylindrospora]QCW06853.1 hypothetical protein [Dactylella tenuis]
MNIKTIQNGGSLNGYYVTGFSDGEACFFISFQKNLKSSLGWSSRAVFQIGVHERDKIILELIKQYFGVGKIFKQDENAFQYRVTSVKDLIDVIIPHFLNYPLITQKLIDFELFKQAAYLLKDKKHLTQEGLLELVSIKSALNLGLSDRLKLAFPNVKPIARPSGINKKIMDPNWLVGFIEAEGCFPILIGNSKTKVGKHVQLVFQVTQHVRDKELLTSLIDFFGCGKYRLRKNGLSGDFIVVAYSDIAEKIIPFLNNFQFYGVKYKKYFNFCKAAELIKNKAHLTAEGLELINNIKKDNNE